MSISVREKPPLRLDYLLTAPNGRTHRWGGDSRKAEDVPQGGQGSSTIPGGFEAWGCKLARQPGVDYSDLVPLTNVRVQGAGGRVAWEGRLERTPRVSGDEVAINPAAVGWQANLEDDKTVREIYQDIDLGRWGQASVQERLNRTSTFSVQDAQTQPDTTTGQPSLAEEITNQPWGAAAKPLVEAWYDSGGVPLGSIYYAGKKNANVNAADTNWAWVVALSADDVASVYDSTANLRAVGPWSGTLTATAIRRFANVNFYYNAANAGADDAIYGIYWTVLAVRGTHGLTVRGTPSATDAGGLGDSDIIAHAVRKWATKLRTTRAGQSTIEPYAFSVPQLAFTDSTTVAEIVRQANRFALRDWAVWDDLTFWLYTRGAGPSRRWRARVGPAQLSETGPQVDRLWDSIVVQYTDVSGVNRTVGPPGSGADVEDAVLADTDPENPATLAGVTRRDLLIMGTSTPAAATEVGRRFLEQSKLLDTSGQAQQIGHALDDRGVLHPAWAMRAGDYLSLIDAHDTGYRRIVRASYDESSKTASLDLDSPPEGLQALLEQLSVALVPLGLS